MLLLLHNTVSKLIDVPIFKKKKTVGFNISKSQKLSMGLSTWNQQGLLDRQRELESQIGWFFFRDQI